MRGRQLVIVTMVTWSTLAHAGPQVTVRGGGKLEARAARSSGELLLQGSLVDDAGHPLPAQHVSLQIARGGGAQGVRFEASSAPRACSPREESLPLEGAETSRVTTDEGGHFCLKVALPVDRYTVRLSTGGGPLLDPARLELAFDLGREAVALAFDPPLRVLRVDGSVALELVAVVDEGSVRSAARSLPVTLTDERGAALGSATTNAGGRARVSVSADALGPPGRGELRLDFAGDVDHAPATLTVPIERHVRVDLVASDGASGAGNAEIGAPIDVIASTAAGAVPTGAVEARLDDVVVGAAPLHEGRARILATFLPPAPAADGATSAALTVRYLPDAPWYEASAPFRLVLPLRGPTIWQKVPLVLTALAVAAFLLLGRLGARRRTSRIATRPRPEAAAAPPPVANVERLGPATGDARGWSGRVMDAHERTPVARAEVTIQAPGFARPEVLASTRTDDAGRFTLPALRDAPGSHILVEGAFHAQVQKPLPPPGDLEIALVSRRRALLDRLVSWARSRGRPFDLRPEPTPAQVRDAARDRNKPGDEAAAAWADAVERASFGAGPVDAMTEDAVERLKP